MSTVLRYICKAGDGDFSRSENFQNYTCLACLFQVWLRWKIALSTNTYEIWNHNTVAAQLLIQQNVNVI